MTLSTKKNINIVTSAILRQNGELNYERLYHKYSDRSPELRLIRHLALYITMAVSLWQLCAYSEQNSPYFIPKNTKEIPSAITIFQYDPFVSTQISSASDQIHTKPFKISYWFSFKRIAVSNEILSP